MQTEKYIDLWLLFSQSELCDCYKANKKYLPIKEYKKCENCSLRIECYEFNKNKFTNFCQEYYKEQVAKKNLI